MEDEKLRRFLNKIKITNVDDFDMSFDVSMWSPIERDVFLMVIRKETAWSYSLLAEFLDGLKNIDFKYDLQFKYDLSIEMDDVYRLFSEWYYNKNLIAFLNDFKIKNDELEIIIDSNEEESWKDMILEFNNILKRIGYSYKLKYSIDEDSIVTNKKKEIDDEIEEENSYYTHDQQLEDEKLLLESIREERKNNNSSWNIKGGYRHVQIGDIDTNSGNVDIDGKVFSYEERVTKNNSLKVTLGVGDKFAHAIYVRAFEGGKNLTKEKLTSIKKDMNIRVRGYVQLDTFTNELLLTARFIDILPDDEPRIDSSNDKRVELHLHTKMSSMDGVSTIEDYMKVAKAMGHSAIALTDHGVVQAFPDAQKASEKYGIKVLYGCELYMIEDQLDAIKNPSTIELDKATYVVFDFETTGLSARYDEIIEFGAVKVVQGMVRESIDILVKPRKKLSQKIQKLTHINEKLLEDKPYIEDAFKKIKDFIGDSILVSHNADFDVGFLNEAARKLNMDEFKNPVIDTLALSRYFFPEARNHRLGSLCRNLDVEYDEVSAHRADYDARVLNDVWQAILSILNKDMPHVTHKQLKDLKLSDIHLKHLRPKHVIALAKDAEGMKDLFKLVSLGHIDYFADVPKIPRTILQKYRSHLLIGSACFNGEIFDYARTKSQAVLEKTMEFYDYIEVQPLSNYSYLINMDDISSVDELKTYIKDIIDSASNVNKLVVATGDAHYANPSDKIYRDVFIYAKGIGNVNHPLHPYSRDDMPYFENPDQHYRSTDEMLEEMSFLGEDKAYEIVVKNTQHIASLIGDLKPIKDKLYTPNIENCAELLTAKCYDTAKKMYGDPLPDIVKNRLEAELNGIVKHGYSVIYYIAMKIVNRANDDGFMVGSRGSVGSSFVATMAGITEVNPLPPHYRCPNCKHSEFVNSEITCGFDLPEKKCPICGHDLIHDGQNIPFATFLGFNADKVPDIDLNFPGDYQQRAHNLTKELLGAGNVFKAGTIETVAEKTAFGYVKGYFERVGPKLGIDPLSVPKAQISFIASGCQDVKRTTGQHPGGIVVIPSEYEVYDFTPIQYPADDKEAAWKTTHFDFHAIHDNVLKLDLLGHVDPMALKQMADSTGVDVRKIPMNDEKVLSLFSSGDALNRHSNFLNETTGALGIPEFGTNFVRGMLSETRPKTFAELLVISGLSHGTDVWNGNAQDLIKDGICTLREVIGCRDDIMTYLSKMGVDSAIAFKIMEDVRKGKKVKPEYEDIMKQNNVPQYYIDSCNKIKYMFPKAHAAAYVMMAIRVGWFKVYMPLYYYATFFSVRSKQFDLEAMIGGEEVIKEHLIAIREKKFDASAKEQEQEKTLVICLEMAERGYKFSNIDLYKSDATKFIVDKESNTLIPPFITIDGLGESAAVTVVEARKEGKFLSKEDLSRRTKLTNTHIEKLESLGVLDGLDETDQMNLFSFFS